MRSLILLAYLVHYDQLREMRQCGMAVSRRVVLGLKQRIIPLRNMLSVRGQRFGDICEHVAFQLVNGARRMRSVKLKPFQDVFLGKILIQMCKTDEDFAHENSPCDK